MNMGASSYKNNSSFSALQTLAFKRFKRSSVQAIQAIQAIQAESRPEIVLSTFGHLCRTADRLATRKAFKRNSSGRSRIGKIIDPDFTIRKFCRYRQVFSHGLHKTAQHSCRPNPKFTDKR
jgi:predicted xylose isomerase-like sugar epimerase